MSDQEMNQHQKKKKLKPSEYPINPKYTGVARKMSQIENELGDLEVANYFGRFSYFVYTGTLLSVEEDNIRFSVITGDYVEPMISKVVVEDLKNYIGARIVCEGYFVRGVKIVQRMILATTYSTATISNEDLEEEFVLTPSDLKKDEVEISIEDVFDPNESESSQVEHINSILNPNPFYEEPKIEIEEDDECNT